MRTVEIILDIMGDKYSRTVGEKTLTLMRDITNFEMEGNMENIMDRYDKLINDVKKKYLAKNLRYVQEMFIGKMKGAVKWELPRHRLIALR